MKRIIIIGNNGSGKSTFAERLGEKLHREVIHLDKLYWKSGWKKRYSKDEWRSKVKELINGKEWIIDGNYKSTMNMRIDAADTIIFFDIPKWICFYRVIKRKLQDYDKTRTDLAEDCKEPIGMGTLSMMKFIILYPTKIVYKKLNSVSSIKRIVVFKNNKDIDDFLRSL